MSNIIVSGRHDGITKEMRDYAQSKTSRFEKHLDRVTSVQFTLDHVSDRWEAEIIAQAPRAQTLVVKDEGEDMFAVIDAVTDTMERQLRKMKDKLQEKHPNHGTDGQG